MCFVNTGKIKSPWDISIFLNNGYLDDIEISFRRVVLRECDLDDFILNWCESHLNITSDVRVSYNAVNSNLAAKGFCGFRKQHKKKEKHK